MAILNTEAYVDTDITGLVNIVEHNLEGTPDIFITEWDGFSEIYTSLMDARIAEVKTLDSNRVQITFSATFQGYLYFLLAKVDNPSDHQRIIDLEKRYSNVVNLIEDKVSKDQWIQMNTLFSNQITYLQNQIKDLEVQIAALKTDVDAL